MSLRNAVADALKTSPESLRAEIRAKADAVFEAHRDLVRSDIEEQLEAHLENEFPDVSWTLVNDVIEDVLLDNFDPAPYCSYGHRSKATCDCGPIAENE